MCLYNQALADVRSTGAGIKCLYCSNGRQANKSNNVTMLRSFYVYRGEFLALSSLSLTLRGVDAGDAVFVGPDPVAPSSLFPMFCIAFHTLNFLRSKYASRNLIPEKINKNKD